MKIHTRRRTRIKLSATRPILDKVPEDIFVDDAVSSDLSLFERLDANLGYFHSVFDRSFDIAFREFQISDGRHAALIYVNVLCDAKIIDAEILDSLIEGAQTPDREHRHLTLDEIQEACVTTSNTTRVTTLSEAIRTVVEENGVLCLIDHEREGLSLSASGGVSRSIDEPNTESVIRGPREGFNEDMGTSVSLVRRRLRTSDLKAESYEIGTYTKTKVAICYLDGVVSPGIVEEVRKRIKRIDTDGIIDSGYIEGFIEDSTFSPFPQMQNTERPDVVAASLLEGRVAIIANGSPFALIVPVTFWSGMQASEDYYERWMIANAIRLLRYGFLFINLYLPSLYVAITTFHQELLPEKALFSIAAAREVTPFPAVIEALIMEITFEALREAGVRLPKAVGSTISIVGALVIGQAAVQAGIVSAPMVIVVSVTGIGSFVIPRYNYAIALRMLRFPMILLAAFLGLFGLVIGTLAIVIHLCSLRSFGIPYLSPISPFKKRGLKDTFGRAPHWSMRWRALSPLNPRRQTDAMAPNNRAPDRRSRQPQS